MQDNYPGKSFGLELNPRKLELCISNQSEKRFISRLMKNGQKPI